MSRRQREGCKGVGMPLHAQPGGSALAHVGNVQAAGPWWPTCHSQQRIGGLEQAHAALEARVEHRCHQAGRRDPQRGQECQREEPLRDHCRRREHAGRAAAAAKLLRLLRRRAAAPRRFRGGQHHRLGPGGCARGQADVSVGGAALLRAACPVGGEKDSKHGAG